MKKGLILCLLSLALMGCNKNTDELKLIGNDDTYYINKYDYTFENGKMVSIENIYAYQFLENNKCKRIEINGEYFYKDGKKYKIPESIKISDKKESSLMMNGFYMSNINDCRYKLNDGKIDITTNKKTISGEYQFNNDKLEVKWEDDIKAVYENKKLDFYVDATVDYILDVKDIYDYFTISYSFINNINSNNISKDMSVDLWAEKTINNYRANITINDFLELNSLEAYNDLSNSTTLSDQTWYNEGNINLNIPIQRLDSEGVISQLSKKNNISKDNIKIKNMSSNITLQEVNKNDIALITYDINNITSILKLK